ncbi:MAG: NAD(P)/FAD-dependent oxidoreductase [Archaeoglobaceae archaeon]
MIQIYGAGMAGSFLFMLLRDQEKVKIFDVRKVVDCRCAWGIAYRQAKKLYKLIGVDLDEYVLSKPELAVANGIEMKNLNIVTFDRRRLLQDLWRELDFGEVKADLRVDATGVARAYLPPIANDRIYYCVQSVERFEADENVYAYAVKTGYAWAFPLGDGRWHVGAGDTSYERAAALVEKLKDFYGFGGDAACSCRARIRMLPPSRCRPFVAANTVGVGEAIGCVSGFGEGNAPSLECAKILAEEILDGELRRYEERVIENFRWIELEHEFVEAVQIGRKLSALLKLPRVMMIERRRSASMTPRLVSLIRRLI